MKHQFLRKMLVLSAAILLSYSTFSQTVTICTQVWDVKNLDVSTYRNGDPIPEVTDPSQWAGLTTGAWCYYQNNSANGPIYGKLYNWYAVNDPRGLAPLGWHVPSYPELTALETCLGGPFVAGGALKESGNTHWLTPNTGATNSSGWTGLPGGFRYDNGTFIALTTGGIWWSTTAGNSPVFLARHLSHVDTDFSFDYGQKTHGFSVRCLRDACTSPTFSVCPGNQAANTASNSCNAIVNYSSSSTGTPAPAITYSFAGATSGSGAGNGSGSTFSKGTTTVTLTATNSCGTATCSFNVVVTDATPPTIVCATPVTINTTPGLCTGTTTLTPPTVSDNCTGTGNALNFDGGNDFVTIPHSSSLNLSAGGQLTFEAWVNPANTGMWRTILMKGIYGYGFAIQSSNHIYFWDQSVGGGNVPASDVAITPNAWNHVAVTVLDNGSTLTVNYYINGVNVGTKISTIPQINDNTNALVLGIQGTGGASNFFNGSMDELRIWNVVRTQAQIQSSMNSELSSGSGLVAAYHFNQGVAAGNNAGITTAIDASGNGNNGTLNNFALTGTTSNWIGGNVSSAPTLTNNAPATYPIGNTTVTWTATDANNNTATCTQVVTVIAPEINVLGNAITIVDGDNSPSATDDTDFGQPLPSVPVIHTFTIENNGTAPLNISSLSMSGAEASSFTIAGISTPLTIAAVGSTTFTVSFAAAPVGNYNAMLNINSNDCDEAIYNFALHAEVSCQPAAFSACPANISVNTTANQCNAVVTYTATVTGVPAPFVSYTFEGATTSSGSGTGSGSTFNKGTTTVTINATNACGNVNCIFTVTVVDNQPPALTGTAYGGTTATNACKANAATAAPFSATNALQGYTDNCSGILTATLTNTNVTGTDCGWTVTYTFTITDANSNALPGRTYSNTGSDQTAPVLVGTLPTGGSGINACSAPAGPTEAAIAALYHDACGGAITVVKTGTPTTGCNWTVTYHYTIADQCGNFATAIDITYSGSDQTAPVLVGAIPAGATNQSLCFDAIPAGPTAAAIAALYSDCNAISVTKTGTPTGDNCNWTVTYHYVIKDACNNEATPVDITYSGGDNTDPLFTVFPSNMSAGGCRDVLYTVVATDNCSTPTLSYVLSGATTESGTGTGEGSVLNEGVTTVTITATDACNNSKQSSFTITVVDLELPVIEVLDISRSFSADNYGCSIDLGASATDNCHLVSLTSNAPACFPTGSTVVTWTAIDQHGNTSTKTQTVTRVPSTIDFSICAGVTRTIYTGTFSGQGPLGPQSINLTTIVAGGLSPYTYSWSPAAGLSSTTIPNPVAAPTVTTTYTLTVTDALNNSIYASITINVLPLSAAVFSGNGNNLKFRVCHKPPGNPSNPQNINVSVNALNAHLTSGSNGHNNCYLGPCTTNCVNTSQQNYNGRGVNVIVPRQAATADKFTVNVSPNPTSNEFLIRVFSKSREPITMRLIDNIGAFRGVYLPAPGTSFVVLGKNLVSGIYFAEVTQGQDKKVVKLVKLN